MKWTSIPSMETKNCRVRLSRVSCSRQSYLSRQYALSAFMYVRSLPYCQPPPGFWSGQRTRPSRFCRSASVSSGTWIVKGRGVMRLLLQPGQGDPWHEGTLEEEKDDGGGDHGDHRQP